MKAWKGNQDKFRQTLTHFMSLVSFDTPTKIRKPLVF